MPKEIKESLIVFISPSSVINENVYFLNNNDLEHTVFYLKYHEILFHNKYTKETYISITNDASYLSARAPQHDASRVKHFCTTNTTSNTDLV